MNLIIEKNKEQIAILCKKYFVKELYVFGSVTGNDYVDNLLQFETLLKMLLNRNIDLIPAIPIRNGYLKQSIEQSKQLLYAA